MPAPNRFAVLACAALAVATPIVGAAFGRVPRGAVRPGLLDDVLYWPLRLLDALPGRLAVLRTSALHVTLLYFAGYLLLWWVARRAWALGAARARRRPGAPA